MIIRKLKKRVVLLLLTTPIFLSAQQESATGIRHSLFIAGPQFTGILGENSEVVWDSKKPGARDGYVLKNGNILICWADEVREYNKDKEIILTYKRAEPSMELGTAVRLKNGNTMITESGARPRLIEIDKEGKIVINVPLRPETDNVHMQTRMARKLQNGNYLVPHLLAFAVKEYERNGNVVNTFHTNLESLGGSAAENWPFTAIRLKDGNTLVTLTHGNKVVELDANGNVVWKLTNADLEGDPLVDPCGAQRLPNGNTVITSYGARNGLKIIEVNQNKEIIWSYKGKNAHHFQVLTTNGKKIKGKPLK